VDLGIGDRVAIVTGASRGIGRAAAAALVAEGVSVVLGARDPAALRVAVEELRSAGGEVTGLECDVLEPDSARALRDAALSAHGRIDILVNNAGGGGGPLDQFDEDEWQDVYRKNVTAAVRLADACLPSMLERRWGRIVNVASTMARHADPRFGSYGAAKAALLHVTRNLALRWAADGVLVNAVLPGLTRTEGVTDGFTDVAVATGRTPADIERRMMERQPIASGRLGEPGEVAAVIAFLCSAQASWVAGALVNVDGGTLTDVP